MDLQYAIPMLEKHPKTKSRAQLGACMQAVYRLVQASREFYLEISNFLIKKREFIKSQVEPCLLAKTINDKHVIVGLYVDDLLFIGDHELITEEIYKINDSYGIRMKYPVTDYVGCELVHEKDGIKLHQMTIINKIADNFKNEISNKFYKTPMQTHTHLLKPENGLAK